MVRAVTRLTLLLVFAFSSFANAYDVELYEDITITSGDGTEISAHMYMPVGDPGETFPVIIFANSWALGEREYDLQAELFASKGYIALAYSARGWYKSTGQINAAGPKDMEDITAILDYIEATPEADINNIGMTGVSYGGGMSLLAAAHEPRIKTVVSFSGWANILDSMYGGKPGDIANGQGQATLRTVWAEILIFAGDLLGNLDPQVDEMRENLRNNTNLDDVYEWAAARSAETFVDEYNARQIPVYMIQGHQDQLFQPTQMERFFSKLNYDDKRLDVNRGIHITGEIGGFINIGGTLTDFMDILGDGPIRNALAGIFETLDIELGDIESNGPWKKAHRWFDHHLRGIAVDPATGKEIMTEKKVQVKDKIASNKVKLWEAPKDSADVTKQTYYFDRSRDHIFAPLKNNLKTSTVSSSDYNIYTGKDTDATTAANDVTGLIGFIDTIVGHLLGEIQLSSTLGGLMEAHTNNFRNAGLNDFTEYYLDWSCPLGCYREAGVMYDTGTFSDEKNIIGAPVATVWVEPSESHVHLTAYVYELDPWGKERLITHGPVTRRGVTPGQPLELKFNLNFTNFTMEAGSKLAVVFDTEDPLYQNAGNYNKRVKILHGGSYDSSIMIPFLN
ncbi:MAG: prolyl oligopeptidase family serine peptidase [Pseudomonadales bacterium]|nr:prolyl oligopeptidase family serine peptidase [Pseudomonadales bacterium]